MNITNKCTGCTACANLCPKRAISITKVGGFYRAVVDNCKCIKCNLCIQKCPQNNSYTVVPSNFYLAESKNIADIKSSTSGGVFSLIANAIIEKNGIVFGVEIDNTMEVFHSSANSIEQCNKYRKSKYVQSDLRDTFVEAKTYLDEGKIVLFSGTPCQIAGLYSFLGDKYENLFTVDFLCHGVPSHGLLLEEIKWLNDKYHGPIQNLSFRRKGSNLEPLYSLDFHNCKGRRVKLDCAMDPYLNAFINSNSLNDCCYDCKYANFNKLSSITIGDSWKGKNVLKSLLIINTDSGAKLFDMIKDSMLYYSVSLKLLLEKKTNLSVPSKPNNVALYECLKNTENYGAYAKSFCLTRNYKVHRLTKIIPESVRLFLKK